MDLLNNKWITTSLCTYEVIAIFTPLPTITRLSLRHRWLGPALTIAMAWHFRKAGK